jgi:hypothetical protein
MAPLYTQICKYLEILLRSALLACSAGINMLAGIPKHPEVAIEAHDSVYATFVRHCLACSFRIRVDGVCIIQFVVGCKHGCMTGP